MIGFLTLFLLMLWTVFTIILVLSSPSPFDFLRGLWFPVICVGYIALFAFYPIVKRILRDEYEYY